MTIPLQAPELEAFTHDCKRRLTKGTGLQHFAFWDVKLEKVALLSDKSEFRDEELFDGSRRYQPIAAFDYLIEPASKVSVKQKCCGRCIDGLDTCVYDMKTNDIV